VGDFAPQTAIFWVALTGVRVTGLQVMGYVSHLLEEGPAVWPPRIDFLCDLLFPL